MDGFEFGAKREPELGSERITLRDSERRRPHLFIGEGKPGPKRLASWVLERRRSDPFRIYMREQIAGKLVQRIHASSDDNLFATASRWIPQFGQIEVEPDERLDAVGSVAAIGIHRHLDE